MGNRTTQNKHIIHTPPISKPHGIILLGAGSVGKTTILKLIRQVKGITCRSTASTMSERALIRNNCVNCIFQSILILTKKKLDAEYSLIYKHEIDIVRSFRYREFDSEEVDPDDASMKALAKAIHKIWNTKEIQDIFKLRLVGKYAMYSNMDHFFNKIERIMSKYYIPSKEDYFKLKKRTTGFVDISYKTDSGEEFFIIDVGGSRGERGKWVYLSKWPEYNSFYKDCIFVVAPDQFCKCLFEDESSNALLENMQLFKECLEQRLMRNRQFILFFTKLDLFRECLKEIDLSILYGERYKGIHLDRVDIIKSLQRIMDELLLFDCDVMESKQMPSDVVWLCGTYCDLNELFLSIVYKDSLQFIKDEFLKINEDKTRTIRTYEIEFMNEQQMENVMKEIEGTLLRKQERLYSSLSSFCAAPSSQ
eukprot:7806_1